MSIDRTVKALAAKGYNTYQCQTKEEAISYIFDSILAADSTDKVMGIAHSETLEELGLSERLKNRSKDVFSHRPPLTAAEDDRNALMSDYYFLSANAVSEDGYIVNVDGSGNRIAASCFGPKQVVFVLGRNKIVKTLDDAIDRTLNYAAIEVTKKYGKNIDKLPCIVHGQCMNCHYAGCPSGALVIHRKPLFKQKVTIIVINQDMGI